jgi:hypothetical protein
MIDCFSQSGNFFETENLKKRVIMRENRIDIINYEYTRFFHCISRCARGTYIGGTDPYTGRDLNHRRIWVYERLKFLSEMFAVRVCAYSVREDHFSLVLYADLEEVESWSDDEVFSRWKQLYRLAKTPDPGKTKKWRERLGDVSWFMRNLNEYVARLANKEEESRGRFWAGRFKSQALLDNAVVLACMAHVDLNPIRAGICQKLEDSEFTSIYERMAIKKEAQKNKKTKSEKKTKSSQRSIDKQSENDRLRLMPFPSNKEIKKMSGDTISNSLSIREDLYLKLLEWTAQKTNKEDKRPAPKEITGFMDRFKILESTWLKMTGDMEKTFGSWAGLPSSLRMYGKETNKKWLKGLKLQVQQENTK